MEKSHVSLEQKICQICGTKFDSGSILLDKRLKQSMEMHTVTGWGICPDDQKKLDDGFIAFIVANPPDSVTKTLKPSEADRTGEILYIKKEAAAQIFNIEITTPMAFIDPEAAEKIKAMMPK